jgi:outer membrane protein insertion porin family
MGIFRIRLCAGLVFLLLGAGVVCIPNSRAADEELDFGLEIRVLHGFEFVGNEAWTDEELLEVIALQNAPWYAPWRPDRYRLDWLEQGLDAIRRRYRANGYRQVSVELTDPVQHEHEAGTDDLRVLIIEGPRTVVGRVEFVGEEPLDKEDLQALLRYREGGAAPFSEAALGGDLYRVADAYFSRGHLTAIVRNSLEESDSTVVIRYEIEAGPVYTIRNLTVEGGDRVKEEFIWRELVLEPGQSFLARNQAESEARLLKTGWFRDVSFKAVNLDAEKAEADLVVSVLERPSGFWELGLGMGSKDRVRFVGAWGNRNVFNTGKGLTLRAKIFGIYDVKVDDPSKNELYWNHEEELIYRHPHFAGTRKTITARLFTDIESRPSSGVRIDEAGLSLGTSIFSGRSSFLDTEGAVTRTHKESLSDALVFDNSRAMTTSVALIYRRDFRNDIFNPESGHYIEVFGQTAGGPILRGDNAFNKLLGQGVKFFGFGDAVFAMRFQAGWIRAYYTSAEISGPDFGVPIEKRYFAGGNNTVRGYRESSLGPRLTEEDATLVQDPQFLTERLSGGGSALLLANIEMRFPIIPEWNIGGEFFLDSGNVWTNWNQVSADDFRLTGDVVDEGAEQAYRTSVGVGVTYRTVVGPLRLDYGFPLRRATFNSRDDTGVITGSERDPDHVWHFSLGHAF